MAAGGLDPYDEDDRYLTVFVRLRLTREELDGLTRMERCAGTNKNEIVTAIMRDVIADEMADQGAERAAGALPQEQHVTKCA